MFQYAVVELSCGGKKWAAPAACVWLESVSATPFKDKERYTAGKCYYPIDEHRLSDFLMSKKKPNKETWNLFCNVRVFAFCSE